MDLAKLMSKKALIFGATGALGKATFDTFLSHGWEVYPAVRRKTGLANEFLLPLAQSTQLKEIIKAGQFDSVIFAQGINMNGDIFHTSDDDIARLMDANVYFVIQSTRLLVEMDAIARKGKIVVLSSLAEIFTRKEKLAYTISKAAVGGLVRSLAVDLGRSHQILVNAILPGVVETPMARNTLAKDQFDHIVGSTPIGHMVTPEDVGNSVYLLGSDLNTGITGQSLLVDNGHSVTFLP